MIVETPVFKHSWISYYNYYCFRFVLDALGTLLFHRVLRTFAKIKIILCRLACSTWWTATRWIRTSDGCWTTPVFTFCRQWTRTVSRWRARASATAVKVGTTHAVSTWTATSRTTSNKTTREDNRKRTPSRNGRPRYSSCCPVGCTAVPWWRVIPSTTPPTQVSRFCFYGFLYFLIAS